MITWKLRLIPIIVVDYNWLINNVCKILKIIPFNLKICYFILSTFMGSHTKEFKVLTTLFSSTIRNITFNIKMQPHKIIKLTTLSKTYLRFKKQIVRIKTSNSRQKHSVQSKIKRRTAYRPISQNNVHKGLWPWKTSIKHKIGTSFLIFFAIFQEGFMIPLKLLQLLTKS